MGTSYQAKEDLDNAIKFYNKSLTEHRTADILEKLRGVRFPSFNFSPSISTRTDVLSSFYVFVYRPRRPRRTATLPPTSTPPRPRRLETPETTSSRCVFHSDPCL